MHITHQSLSIIPYLGYFVVDSCVFVLLLYLEETVELTPSGGVVYTRSSQPLRVRVKPKMNGECQCLIQYRLISDHNDGNLRLFTVVMMLN